MVRQEGWTIHRQTSAGLLGSAVLLRLQQLHKLDIQKQSNVHHLIVYHLVPARQLTICGPPGSLPAWRPRVAHWVTGAAAALPASCGRGEGRQSTCDQIP
jgi:hypothetical protein